MKKPLPKPTESELEILVVLWGRGSSTVRQVSEALTREAGYTTILKLMQIMLEKGLVTRDESDRTHVYAAAVSRERTQGNIVSHLVEKVFGGSAQAMVMRALSAAKSSPAELKEIRALLDRMEGKKP
jgi:BlaI family penicillinase repressor